MIRVVIFILFICLNANSQVNIENLRRGINKEKTFSCIIDGSLDSKSGNKQKFYFYGSNLLSLTYNDNLFFIINSGEFEIDNGSKTEQYYFFHMRDNYHIYNYLFSDVFFQYENDLFRALKSRTLIGVGPRLEEKVNKWLYYSLGSSYMREWNVILNDDYLLFNRWNNYISLNVVTSEQLEINNTIYYQPVFSNFSNYRLYNSFILSVKINDSLKINNSIIYRYESMPPGENIETKDFRIKTGVQIIF
jgi:hypothetical protein